MNQNIQKLFDLGLHGEISTFYAWHEMFYFLAESTIPENIKEFSDEPNIVFNDKEKLSLEEFQLEFEKFVSDKYVQSVEPYSEFRITKLENAFRSKEMIQGYLSNDLKHQPLQFIRSRLKNFLIYRSVSQTLIDDLVIAVTEAIENAVKYSNAEIFFYQFYFQNNVFHIKVVNSLKKDGLSEDELKEKFKADVSLMRGMLVMSNLLDSLDLLHNEEKSRVEFTGSKKLSNS